MTRRAAHAARCRGVRGYRRRWRHGVRLCHLRSAHTHSRASPWKRTRFTDLRPNTEVNKTTHLTISFAPTRRAATVQPFKHHAFSRRENLPLRGSGSQLSGRAILSSLIHTGPMSSGRFRLRRDRGTPSHRCYRQPRADDSPSSRRKQRIGRIVIHYPMLTIFVTRAGTYVPDRMPGKVAG